MPQNGTNGWIMSDLHELSTTATTAEVKQKIYAQWAGSYDEEVLAHEYVGPATTAEKTVEILQAHFGQCGRISAEMLLEAKKKRMHEEL